MNIGDKIKEIRNNASLTQDELAKRCCLSKNTIWNYENNKRDPSISILNNIARALNVTADELLCDHFSDKGDEDKTMKEIKLKEGETIISIDDLKTINLGPNDILIIETDANLTNEAIIGLENKMSNKLKGKILLLDNGMEAKAVIKRAKK